MEKADSKDDLPPLASQNVVFKEIAGDLCEGPPHVGSQAFRRLISHLATTTTTQAHGSSTVAAIEKTTVSSAHTANNSWGLAGVKLILLVVQAVCKLSCDTCSSEAGLSWKPGCYSHSSHLFCCWIIKCHVLYSSSLLVRGELRFQSNVNTLFKSPRSRSQTAI